MRTSRVSIGGALRTIRCESFKGLADTPQLCCETSFMPLIKLRATCRILGHVRVRAVRPEAARSRPEEAGYEPLSGVQEPIDEEC